MITKNETIFNTKDYPMKNRIYEHQYTRKQFCVIGFVHNTITDEEDVIYFEITTGKTFSAPKKSWQELNSESKYIYKAISKIQSIDGDLI